MICRIHNYGRVLEACIEDILSVIKPVDDDRNKRLHAIQELTDSLNSVGVLRGAAVKPFGSVVSILYAKSGDLDVSVDLWSSSDLSVSKKKKQNVLRELMRALQIRGVARSVQFIPNARVPVLQYTSNHFGISCDISINNYPGQIKSRILYWINTIDGRFGDFVLLVKEWAKAKNINDPKNGTLNSYSICLLVLFNFQTCEPAILPPLKEIYDENMAAGNLLGQVISTYTGRFEGIQDNQSWMAKPYRLFIEDPFERPDNAARAVGEEELQLIDRAFKFTSDKLAAGPLDDWNELVSLLCTSTVRCILGDRVRASSYTNATPNQQHQQASSLTGSRSVLTSQWSIDGQTAQPSTEHVTAGLHQINNGSHVYTTGGQPAVPYQYHDDQHSYVMRRQQTSQYQSQHRRSEYSPYQSASTARYEPVGTWFHNGPTWDYRS